MDKRVTIRDIAAAAGVSVATVSYVLNNRQDQKISAATRSKVLKTAGELGYTGARTSRSAADRTGSMALCSCAADGTLLQNDHGRLLQAAARALEKHNHSAMLLSSGHSDRVQKADAVICIDPTDEQCRRLMQHNSIPVIGINACPGFPLSAQVNCDYAAVMRRAQNAFGFDFCVVACDPPGDGLRERISSLCGSDLFFCREISDLLGFLFQNGSRPLAVCSHSAYELCVSAGVNAILTAPDPNEIAAKAVELARLASRDRTISQQDCLVL